MIASDEQDLAHRCVGLNGECSASFADEFLLHMHCLVTHTLQYYGSASWQDFNHRFPLKITETESENADVTSAEVNFFKNSDLPNGRRSDSMSEDVSCAIQNGTAAPSDFFQEDSSLEHSNTPSSFATDSDRDAATPSPSVNDQSLVSRDVSPPSHSLPPPTLQIESNDEIGANLIEKAAQGAKEFERLLSERGLGSPSSRRIGKLRISSRSQGHKVLPNAYLDKGARAAFNKQQQQPTLRAANNILKRAQRPRALSQEHVRHNLATEGTIDVKVNGTLDQVVHISSSVQTENLLCDLTFKATKCAQQKAQNMIEYTSQFGGRFRGRKRLTEPTNRLPFRDEPEVPARLIYSGHSRWPSFPRLRDRYDRYMDKIQVREIERRQEVWHSNLMHVVTHQTYAGEQSTQIYHVLPHGANIIRPASEASTSDNSFWSLVTKAASKRERNPTNRRLVTSGIVESLKKFRVKVRGWRSGLVSARWRRRRNLSLSPSVGRSPRRSRPRVRQSGLVAESSSQLLSSQQSLCEPPNLSRDCDLRSPVSHTRELMWGQKRKIREASLPRSEHRRVQPPYPHEASGRSDSSFFQAPAHVNTIRRAVSEASESHKVTTQAVAQYRQWCTSPKDSSYKRRRISWGLPGDQQQQYKPLSARPEFGSYNVQPNVHGGPEYGQRPVHEQWSAAAYNTNGQQWKQQKKQRWKPFKQQNRAVNHSTQTGPRAWLAARGFKRR